MKIEYHHLSLRVVHMIILITLVFSALALPEAQTVQAASIGFPGPTGSGKYGAGVYVLPNGNFVVSDPEFNPGGQVKVGAVYLYNGTNRTLISRMNGSTANDMVGSGGIKILKDGSFVVVSPRWNNGGASGAGAVTWCSQTLGCPATVTAANSLVGGAASDHVGTTSVDLATFSDYGSITPVSGSAYLVSSAGWGNYKGAVTYCASGSDPKCLGAVSSSNSLVGATSKDPDLLPYAHPGDYVGLNVTLVPNQGYIVSSSYWANGSLTSAGAVVPCPISGSNGCTGLISTSNSLYGNSLSDGVGGGITLLKNGDYVVASMSWGGGLSQDGAVTYCASLSDTNCIGKPVTAANSLTASVSNSIVAGSGITVLEDGNYIVKSPSWRKDVDTRTGAATFCFVSGGTSSCTNQVISAGNSLIGDTNQDNVGSYVGLLPGGAFLVTSSQWHAWTGAVTYCSNVAACMGQQVSASNSLVGGNAGVSWSDSAGGDTVGSVFILSDGEYLAISPSWDAVGTNFEKGAVTFCPAGGCTGFVTPANSLLGAKANDQIGYGGAMELLGGAILISSPNWDNGAHAQAGALTFCASPADCKGQTVLPANSLVGDQDNIQIGYYTNSVLTNGAYIVGSPNWGNGTEAIAGAMTWCPPTGCKGMTVGSSNSLVGSHYYDYVGSYAEEVGDGLFVTLASGWQNDAIMGAGAVTLCEIAAGCSGPITAVNSVLGGVQGIDVNHNGSYYESYMTYEYDAVHHQLIAGLPVENKIVFFTLTTPAATDPASDVTAAGATLNGMVNPNHNEMTVSFEYGLTAGYGSTVTADESPVTGAVDLPVSKAISGLTPNTLYHFRVVADNGESTFTGQDQTFTTAAVAPAAQTDAASSITSSGATLNGTVNANFASSVVSFEYGLDTSYGTSVNATPNPVVGSNNAPVSAVVSGLTPNTLYHYRVTAVNLGGTTHGLDQTFSTPKASAAINLSGLSQVYDGTPRTVTITTTPPGLPLAVTYLGTGGTTYPVTSTPPTKAGSYTVSAAIDNHPVYQGSTSGGFTITTRPLTVTATGEDKPYDSTRTASVSLASNKLAGDEITLSYSGALFDTKAVGPGKTISVTGISISGADSPNYSFNTTASTSAAVTEIPLTVTASGINKVYDGTRSASVNLSSDKLSGDTVTSAYTSALFDDPTVGQNKSVSVSGISISGGDAGNYSLSNTTASATADITLSPSTLIVTGSKPSSSYHETVTFTASVTPTTATGKVTFKDNDSDIAGCIDLILAGGSADCVTNALAVSEIAHNINAAYSGDANFSGSTALAVTHLVNHAATVLQIDTSPAPIIYGQTLRVDVTVTSSFLVPDGSINLTVDGNPVQASSLANGQTTFWLNNLTAGPHTLLAAYTGSSNFLPSSGSQSQNIGKASAVVSLAGLAQVYTGATHAAAATTLPANLPVVVTYAGSLVPPSNAGSYVVIATVADPNYTGEVIDTLQISQARLKVTAADQIRLVGEANPSFSFTLTGFVNGEILDTSGISGSPLLSSLAELSSPPGQYTILCAAGSLSSQNYSFQFIKGILTVHTPPSLKNPIPDMLVVTGQPFVFSIGPNTFEDLDLGDTLGYSAQLSDGGVLPAWLIFSPSSRTFTGTPLSAEVLSIQVRAADRYSDSAIAGFKLEAKTPPAQNRPPVAVNDLISTPANTPTTINLLANDSDPDGDSLSLASISTAAHGSLQIGVGGQITFLPDPLFSGIETVVYILSDGRTGTAQATLTMTTTAVPPGMIGVEDATTTLQDTPVDIPVLDNDLLDSGSDPDGLSIQDQPEHGTVLLNSDRTITYQPEPGFSGMDAFTYLLGGAAGSLPTSERPSGEADKAAVKVTVVVGKVEDVAVAAVDTIVTQENTAINADVLVNDSVSSGAPILLGIQQASANGQVTINPNQTVRYTPNPYFHGTDHFSYSMGNGGLGFDTAEVTVIVQPVNQVPAAVGDHAAGQIGSAIAIDVLANDSDVEDASLRVTSVTQGEHGLVEITAGEGSVVYTSQGEFIGEDRFLYTITDSDGAINFAQVTVLVQHAPNTIKTTYLPLLLHNPTLTIYQQDFSAPVGSEWSINKLSTSPSGEKFLGDFGNDTLNLNLASMPAHTRVQVTFDLYILRSWDGNQILVGPDQWLLQQDGNLLLHTTFSNLSSRQAFPGSYPSGDFTGRSNALAVNTLGYSFGFSPMDTIYHLVYTFDHQASSLQLTFAGLGLQSLGDESWGLDNVSIRVE